MSNFRIECSQATDQYVIQALNGKKIKHVVKQISYLNDYGEEIMESDIDNDSGDPALMVAGVIIEIDCDADEADLDIALQEVASAEGINMEIV